MALTIDDAIARLMAMRESGDARVLIELIPPKEQQQLLPQSSSSRSTRAVSPPNTQQQHSAASPRSHGSGGAAPLSYYVRDSTATASSTDDARWQGRHNLARTSSPPSASSPTGRGNNDSDGAAGPEPWKKYTYQVPRDAHGVLKPSDRGPIAEGDAQRREESERRQRLSPRNLRGTASPPRRGGPAVTSGSVPVYRYVASDFDPVPSRVDAGQWMPPQRRALTSPLPPNRLDLSIAAASPAASPAPIPMAQRSYVSPPPIQASSSGGSGGQSRRLRTISPPRSPIESDVDATACSSQPPQRLPLRSPERRSSTPPRYQQQQQHQQQQYEYPPLHHHAARSGGAPFQLRSVSPPRGRNTNNDALVQPDHYPRQPSPALVGASARMDVSLPFQPRQRQTHAAVARPRSPTATRTTPTRSARGTSGGATGATTTRSSNGGGGSVATTPRGKRSYAHVQSNIRRPPPVDTSSARFDDRYGGNAGSSSSGFFAITTAAPGSDGRNVSPRRRPAKGIAWVV